MISLLHFTSNSATWLTLLLDLNIDGSNNLKFHWIDLIEAAKRSIQNPLYAEKLYHAFETATDAEG
jgi:hypothetical protein